MVGLHFTGGAESPLGIGNRIGAIGGMARQIGDAALDTVALVPAICVNLHKEREIPVVAVPLALLRVARAYVEECSSLKEGLPLASMAELEARDARSALIILHRAGVPLSAKETAVLFPTTPNATEAA